MRAVDLIREARQADNTGVGGGASQDQTLHPHAPKGSANGGQFAKSGNGAPKPKPKAAPKAAAAGKPAAGVLPPPTTSRTMKPGDSGDDVRNLQYAMGLLGFQVPQDGSYDKTTMAAVAAAQQKLGIKPTGHASASLLRKIQDSVRLSPCVKESIVPRRRAVDLLLMARVAERFDPSQPRDDHGRWSLLGEAIALLKKGGHDAAAAHLVEAQKVSARPPAEREFGYHHDHRMASRIRDQIQTLDEQHARPLPGSVLSTPEARKANRAKREMLVGELTPYQSREQAHEHFFGQDEPGASPREAEVDNKVRSAYRDAIAATPPSSNGRAARHGDRVPLADIRDRVGSDATREEVDASLMRLASRGAGTPDGGILETQENQQRLSDADRAAALHVPGQRAADRVHFLSLADPSGRHPQGADHIGTAQDHVAALQATPMAHISTMSDREISDNVNDGKLSRPEAAAEIRKRADAHASNAAGLRMGGGDGTVSPAFASGANEHDREESRLRKLAADIEGESPGDAFDRELASGSSGPSLGAQAAATSSSANHHGPATLAERGDHIVSDKDLTDRQKRSQLKSLGMTPAEVDSLVPPAKKAPPAAAKMARGKAKEPLDVSAIHSRLAAAQTREEGHAALQGLTMEQLRQVSPESAAVFKTKPKLAEGIVNLHVGGRIQHQAVMATGVDSSGAGIGSLHGAAAAQAHSPAAAKMARAAKAAPAKKAAKAVRAPTEIADAVRRQSREGAILDELSDAKAADLRRIALELNVQLPATAKTAAQRKLHIAQTVSADSRRLRGGI